MVFPLFASTSVSRRCLPSVLSLSLRPHGSGGLPLTGQPPRRLQTGCTFPWVLTCPSALHDALPGSSPAGQPVKCGVTPGCQRGRAPCHRGPRTWRRPSIPIAPGRPHAEKVSASAKAHAYISNLSGASDLPENNLFTQEIRERCTSGVSALGCVGERPAAAVRTLHAEVPLGTRPWREHPQADALPKASTNRAAGCRPLDVGRRNPTFSSEGPRVQAQPSSCAGSAGPSFQ